MDALGSDPSPRSEARAESSQSGSLFSSRHTLSTPLLPSPSVRPSSGASQSRRTCPADGLRSSDSCDAGAFSRPGALADSGGCASGSAACDEDTFASQREKRRLSVHQRRVAEAKRKMALLELDEFLHVARIYFFAGFLLLPILWLLNVRMFSQARLSSLAERLFSRRGVGASLQPVTGRPVEEVEAVQEREQRQSVGTGARSRSRSQRRAPEEREANDAEPGGGEVGRGRLRVADVSWWEGEAEDVQIPPENFPVGVAAPDATEAAATVQKFEDLRQCR